MAWYPIAYHNGMPRAADPAHLGTKARLKDAHRIALCRMMMRVTKA
jgi:hypothetical protein